jgi:hypothetical protein
MFRSATPIVFFQQQTHILLSHVSGVLDGRRDSIHDARIVTRRIREVLPLTHEWQRRSVADDLFTRIQRIGRSLCRVRDAASESSCCDPSSRASLMPRGRWFLFVSGRSAIVCS